MKFIHTLTTITFAQVLYAYHNTLTRDTASTWPTLAQQQQSGFAVCALHVALVVLLELHLWQRFTLAFAMLFAT